MEKVPMTAGGYAALEAELRRLTVEERPRIIQAISDAIQGSLSENGVKPAHIEGGDRAGWILLDYFDFIVHIFNAETRAFYALERLWGSADRIAVPEPAPPSRE